MAVSAAHTVGRMLARTALEAALRPLKTARGARAAASLREPPDKMVARVAQCATSGTSKRNGETYLVPTGDGAFAQTARAQGAEANTDAIRKSRTMSTGIELRVVDRWRTGKDEEKRPSLEGRDPHCTATWQRLLRRSQSPRSSPHGMRLPV